MTIYARLDNPRNGTVVVIEGDPDGGIDTARDIQAARDRLPRGGIHQLYLVTNQEGNTPLTSEGHQYAYRISSRSIFQDLTRMVQGNVSPNPLSPLSSLTGRRPVTMPELRRLVATLTVEQVQRLARSIQSNPEAFDSLDTMPQSIINNASATEVGAEEMLRLLHFYPADFLAAINRSTEFQQAVHVQLANMNTEQNPQPSVSDSSSRDISEAPRPSGLALLTLTELSYGVTSSQAGIRILVGPEYSFNPRLGVSLLAGLEVPGLFDVPQLRGRTEILGRASLGRSGGRSGLSWGGFVDLGSQDGLRVGVGGTARVRGMFDLSSSGWSGAASVGMEVRHEILPNGGDTQVGFFLGFEAVSHPYHVNRYGNVGPITANTSHQANGHSFQVEFMPEVAFQGESDCYFIRIQRDGYQHFEPGTAVSIRVDLPSSGGRGVRTYQGERHIIDRNSNTGTSIGIYDMNDRYEALMTLTDRYRDDRALSNFATVTVTIKNGEGNVVGIFQDPRVRLTDPTETRQSR